ncbi:MAG TPA: aldehyde dehydrogenase family protein [Acetobacteraceae bacterium]|nr:aldehyde dehydrogenase family protein [Acetobacteraceae bacterium]
MTETVQIISPIDGRVYAERPIATAAEIRAAVAQARHAQARWREAALAERAAGLTRFLDALLGMNAEIVPELAWQMGRPVRFGGEARGVEERGRHMIAIAEEALKPIQRSGKDGFRRFITREPLGTMLVIAPWNYPYLTAINAVVPGLMAGNAVILKHASQTLLVGERFAAAARNAGLPEGIFQNLAMSHQATEALIGSGAIDHINFTGSVEGGRRIEKAAAGTFASLALELGGKDPAYVREDAPLEASIENLVDGAFFNSGQSCCGIERIYVHETVFDRFLDGFVEHAKTYALGNPLDMGTMVGPMAQPRLADQVREQMAEALRKGARAHLHTQDDRDRPGSPYLPPEVLTNVNHQMAVMREESFGPVVGIMKVRDDDEAVALMNDSPYGLTASIWTNDIERAAALGARIETGTVFMNRCDYLDPGLVWTGVKETGKGGSLSEIGYHNLTQPKSYHLRRI